MTSRLALRASGAEMFDEDPKSKRRLTSPPTLLALYPWARRASLSSHSLTPLSHIALASEPAVYVVAGSLYRLGQLLRQEPLGERFGPALVCRRARASGRRAHNI